MSVTASDARKRLFPLIQQVNDDQTAVEIVSRNGTAFLVPEDEWRSLQETAFLLRSPANAARLMASIAEVERGEAMEADLVEPDDDVMPAGEAFDPTPDDR